MSLLVKSTCATNELKKKGTEPRIINRKERKIFQAFGRIFNKVKESS